MLRLCWDIKRCWGLQKYDRELTAKDYFIAEEAISSEIEHVEHIIKNAQDKSQNVKATERLNAVRSRMDEGFAGVELPIERKKCEFKVIELSKCTAEWVIPLNVIPGRRLLFFHGGGFAAGSAESHRIITTYLAMATNSSVLAVNYRLMPEYKRGRGVDDCREAYDYILENSPSRKQPVTTLFMGGDSAGGNLTYTTALWARDNHRRAANAMFGICPFLDMTFSAKSMKRNLKSDLVLKKALEPVINVPLMLRIFLINLAYRKSPLAAKFSPVFHSLHNLPPSLIQVSALEMCLDDAVRFQQKAQEYDTKVDLQIWPRVNHTWHIFEPVLPEARMALDEIVWFLNDNA